ncbi:hypothetical protein BFJ63_vAg15084 [Fusarium oxysporum f. sp. narcissi]|uniref:Uncharacterized protein n=3 Tax=Fusarium oxysporum TaxID=5507 RepID=A0A420PLN4_FUSOX|nr:hypothetical protein BFJ65_g15562 [Fusarium oxysporum f. sp. cepae]RKK84484.1 hypothetical protein BFJ71_g14531 [Fusarium oxysporum]RYC82016.1 hypothetical protein BFJ63_vAg15084 [Fusarium oxysporum f. sp. narcissi]RKK30706.1 hypothetical protein BFJ66_g16188 [Fusarium oxysporum f. sp. cepae]RKK32301.1 hypothetical protein BFJ67_g14808 [Fusarium oxysporum f. sp. cepae]
MSLAITSLAVALALASITLSLVVGDANDHGRTPRVGRAFRG